MGEVSHCFPPVSLSKFWDITLKYVMTASANIVTTYDKTNVTSFPMDSLPDEN
jgi:hypothetical protein